LDAFVENPIYQVIESQDDRRCFLVGRTGSGKSAALQHLENTRPERVVRISPEDLSLPYITDLQVIKYLDSLDVKLDPFWIALWKHVLIVEIIRRRYKIDSPEEKQRFLDRLRERLTRDAGKQAALQYLDDFEGRFWVEADERVKQITNTFTERIGTEAGVDLGAGPAKLGGKVNELHEEELRSHQELAARFQRVVNDTQLARLNKMLTILDDEILDHAHYTYVIIDDLDRDWVDERITNDLIRCLFRTVLDMQKVTNLKVLVALRSNIFQELDFGRSGGQEEKFRSLVLEMTWTDKGLEEMLEERLKVAARKSGVVIEGLRSLLPHTNKSRGNPLRYILDRTLKRPRDAIAFVNECLVRAAGGNSISWEDILAAERQYSSRRLLALRDEWKPTYPHIDAIFARFRGAPARMTREQFTARLDDCMLLVTEPQFTGVSWLNDVSNAMWGYNVGKKSWAELYQSLTAMLYEIGLIGMASRTSAAPVFYDEDPLLAESITSLERCEYFFLHRTFQRALDVETADEDRGR
jgi:hypothetical protein